MITDQQTLEHAPAVGRGRQLRDAVIVYALTTVVVFVLAFGFAALRWVVDWGQPRSDWSLSGCLAFAVPVAVVLPAVLLVLALAWVGLRLLRRKGRRVR